MRASREEWSKRVARWLDSGLTAEQFAIEVGINAATLKFWKYKLGKRAEPVPSSKPQALRLVELSPAKSRAEAPLELELAGRRCIRVPAGLDADALKRLIAFWKRRDSGFLSEEEARLSTDRLNALLFGEGGANA